MDKKFAIKAKEHNQKPKKIDKHIELLTLIKIGKSSNIMTKLQPLSRTKFNYRLITEKFKEMAKQYSQALQEHKEKFLTSST